MEYEARGREGEPALSAVELLMRGLESPEERQERLMGALTLETQILEFLLWL